MPDGLSGWKVASVNAGREAVPVAIELPEPDRDGPVSLEAAVLRRRTRRTHSPSPISTEQLSQLLWVAQGVTGDEGERAAPSAERSYPLQILVVVGAVAGLDPGLYGYVSGAHQLQCLDGSDHRSALGHAALQEQPWLGRAAAVLVVAADMTAVDRHFGHQPPEGRRGRRYAYMESGAVAENVHLQAEALGLACVLVGGFDDERVGATLALGPGIEPTALLAIGHPAGSDDERSTRSIP